MKAKSKMKNNMKTKAKMKIKMIFLFLFSFRFSFSFLLLLLLSMSFCIFFKSRQFREAINGQLPLDWPRSAIAFLLRPRGLEVPQTVISLLLGLEVLHHFGLRIFHVTQRCQRWSTPYSSAQKCHSTKKYGIQPNSNVQNSMMLFNFFFFYQQYHFLENLVQKIKIVNLR